MAPKFTNIVISTANTPEGKALCMEVRIKVFIHEQKFELVTETNDIYNDVADNWVATADEHCEDGTIKRNVPIGTVRMIHKEDGICVLGRLAVIQEARGLSLGKQLVAVVVEAAKTQNKTAVEIHAQYDKREFYEKLGFVVEKGDEETFLEDGYPHYRMFKRF